jgi:hypothetical protein
MVDYKWTLRKGGGKMICPKCGQRRFVPYVSSVDGRTLAGDQYGRCDREQNCGYQMYPGKEIKAENVQPVERQPETPLRFYPAAVVTDTRTPLFEYVSRLLGVSRAVAIWQRYKIGRDGQRTVFWQIAKDMTIRAGKSIPYKPNGHRDKTDKYPANWVHKSKAWDGTHTGTALQQCYFGEHLLNAQPTWPVVIVESEKTAAVFSEISRGWIWLASGGSQGLKNAEKNKALEGREVWLLPDHGQYWNWATVAHANGWEIFDQVEKNPVFPGCDVLDLLEAGALGADLLKYRKL